MFPQHEGKNSIKLARFRSHEAKISESNWLDNNNVSELKTPQACVEIGVQLKRQGSVGGVRK
jgi:hypothetical protein